MDMKMSKYCCQLFASLALVACLLPATGMAQQRGQSDRIGSAPANGEPLPDVTVYLADGTPISTTQLKEHYTVLVFGCLT
jgi:cytochrome oxidase Cu insertion factor (SCO1/SenC/PrrC family)